MKNKGLIISLAAIGVIVLIGIAAFLGFFWGRGWFGAGCAGWNGSFSRLNTPSVFNRGGMMWGRGFRNYWSGDSIGEHVISVEEARNAVEEYIEDFNNEEELRIKEIMIFDNHAYAIIQEEETGIGAFEVLVDPDTLDVFPEMGPNMMWNLKYGHMGSGMMGRSFDSVTEDMPFSEEEALQIANEYLKNAGSNLSAEGHPDRFYGYYTIHTIQDGEIAGMLSVNGYDGDVFLHTWHGDFIEMTDHAAEEDHSD